MLIIFESIMKSKNSLFSGVVTFPKPGEYVAIGHFFWVKLDFGNL